MARRSVRALWSKTAPARAAISGIAAVARSAPDGYTLLMTSSAFVVNPGLYKQVPYDPFKDFAPVAALDTSPNVFIATTDFRHHVDRRTDRARQGQCPMSSVTPAPASAPRRIWRRAVEDRGRHQDDARAVSEAPARPCRASWPARCRWRAARCRARTHSILGGNRARARRHRPAALVRSARRADHGRVGLQGFRRRHVPHACWRRPARRPTSSIGSPMSSLDRAEGAGVPSSKLRKLGFEVIASGPDGLRLRIAEEVPRYRELIAKAGIRGYSRGRRSLRLARLCPPYACFLFLK